MTSLHENALRDVSNITEFAEEISPISEQIGQNHQSTESHIIPSLLISTGASRSEGSLSLDSSRVSFLQPPQLTFNGTSRCAANTAIGLESHGLFDGAFEGQHTVLGSFAVEAEGTPSYILEGVSFSPKVQQRRSPQYSSMAITTLANPVSPQSRAQAGFVLMRARDRLSLGELKRMAHL